MRTWSPHLGSAWSGGLSSADLLAEIEEQLDEIEIFVEYEDVFGTKFKLEDI